MSLEPGSRLGPCVISSAIGAGGMGEVYRARDPRLGRDVAVKVLPASLSTDGGREFFYRDADGSIVAVPVDVAAGTFSAGKPQSLFHVDVPRDAGYQYAVSRDGQRFLVNTTTGPASTMSVFTDWRKLVE